MAQPVYSWGAADRNRTCNPQLRRLVLYPVELPPPLTVTAASNPMEPNSPKRECVAREGPMRGTERGNLVGAVGFELTTTWSQTRCATRLRYAPKLSIVCRTMELANMNHCVI